MIGKLPLQDSSSQSAAPLVVGLMGFPFWETAKHRGQVSTLPFISLRKALSHERDGLNNTSKPDWARIDAMRNKTVTQELNEQRDRAEALISQGKQLLKLAALDFGMQFARDFRQDIETSMQELQEGLTHANAAQIKQNCDDLQIKLNELDQEMLQFPSTSP